MAARRQAGTHAASLRFSLRLRLAGSALLLRSILLALVVLLALPAAASASILAESAPTESPAEPEGSVAQDIALDRAEGEDLRIAGRLQDIFANVPSLNNVNVEVDEGVVSLSGIVPDDAAKSRAEAIASGVDGVVTVENALERDVSVDLGGQVGGLGDKVQGLIAMLPLLGAALLVALLVAGLGYLIASFTSLWHRLAPNSFLAELIASAIRFVAVIGGIVIALDMIGAGALLGAVLGGAGVIGIALGFAMRDTIENYVASLMLSLRQPFRAADHVLIDEHEGRVIRLTSRATVLMTLDGNHLRIPNSTVFKAIILNYTRNPQRRFEFELGIDADDDPNQGRNVGVEVLRGLPFVLDNPPPEARVQNVGDSNIVLQFLGWIDQREADWHKARSRAIAAVKAELERAGFALPEPIYRLRFDARTTPLPLQGVAAQALTGDAPSATTAPPSHSSSPPTRAHAASTHEDLAPENEIKRMVDSERQDAEEQKSDLLDSGRPVE